MNAQTLVPIFKGLAHPTRLQILSMLRHGETCMCQLERAIEKRQPYISQQLMALRKAGLVESRQVGVYVYYRLDNPFVKPILDSVCPPYDLSKTHATDGCDCDICKTIWQQQGSSAQQRMLIDSKSE